MLKESLRKVAIQPNQRSNFNWINSAIIFSLACCTVGMIHFVIFEAENMMDFGNSFYGASNGILNVISLSSNILKADKIFQLIKGFEKIINERKRIFMKFIQNFLN